LKDILNAISRSTAGIKHVIIIDDTGITIMSESKFKFSEDNVSVEKLGAIGGAVYIAGEEQGQILGYGDIGLQLTEYDKGMIFSMKIGQGVLCLVTDLNVQVGFIRVVLKKYAPKIATILNRYLKLSEGADFVSKELKELIDSDSATFI
jgi:predicted regulator of Ras-like GTPase activity (Roadblock/LC7/MglB family)